MTVIALPGRPHHKSTPIVRQGLVASLDIGSSKISCLIGELRTAKRGFGADGQHLRVVGVGQTLSRGVRAGAVVDANQAEQAIRNAVDAAERQARATISRVMVAFSGGRPTTLPLTGMVKTQTGVVNGRDLNHAVATALRQADFSQRSVLHINPVGHALDRVSGIEQPLGLHGNNLKVDIAVTTVDQHYLKNLAQAIGQAYLEPQGYIFAPFAAAKAALTKDEGALGCVTIDIGGAVTTLGFMRAGKLVAADSVPIGGMHVTHDIAQGLSTSIAHAERMKTLWGTALEGGHLESEMLAVPLLGERGTDSVQRIPRSQLTMIIRARLEELFEHCAQRLAQPQFAASAGARVVLTGGSALLAGLTDLVATMLQRPVRCGSVFNLNGLAEHCNNSGFAVAGGALINAAWPEPHYSLEGNAEWRSAQHQGGMARRVGRWLAEAL